MPGSRRRGLALVLVAGVLAVLVSLAAAFVLMVQMERRSAGRRLAWTKACLLARSGLEDALARLDMVQEFESAGGRYGGEDWNANGVLDGVETAAQVHHITAAGSLPDREDCPVRHALRPSFWEHGASVGEPRLVAVEGRPRGLSGRLTGESGGAGNVYAVKVLESPGLHVNGGNPVTASEDGYDRILKRILGNLAEELGAPLARADGEALVATRPAGGWVSFEQLRDIALGGSPAKLEALAPYLALDAWVDRKVIRPTVLTALLGVSPKAWSEIKQGVSDDAGPGEFRDGRGGAIPGVPELEARAPVQLSWARARKPVLVALIRDLEGLWLDESTGTPTNDGDTIGTVRSAAIPLGEARRVADRLQAYGGDLSSWSGFHAFCDTLDASVFSGTPTEIQAKRDVLKANFNPNSDLRAFNPNPTLWKRVDKNDLLMYSAEFSTVPCRHRIECAGRLLDANGTVRGECVLALSQETSQIRLTTQGEFMAEDLGRLEEAGDEPAASVRMPGFRAPGAPDLFSQSRGAAVTWGHSLSATSQYPGTWLQGGSRGIALQSYPEPVVAGAGPGTLALAPAAWDGNLQLATMETPADDAYNVTAPLVDMKMLARFGVRLDLDVFDGPDGALHPDDRLPDVTPDSVLPRHGHEAGTLYPDGCYSERNRAPTYADRGNAHGFRGFMSFWMKPHCEATACPSRGHPYVTWTNFNGPSLQFFFLGQSAHMEPRNQFILQYENGHDPDDDRKEFDCNTPTRAITPHRWHLMTVHWDFQTPQASPCYQDIEGLVVDDGQGPADLGSQGYNGQNAEAFAADITEDAPESWGGPVVPHQIVLGRRWASAPGYDEGRDHCNGWGADATFDEFVIYDLGVFDLGQTEFGMMELATNRYREGRYYRGAAYPGLTAAPVGDQAGAYFTAPLALPVGAALQRIHWTWYRPAALPGDYAELELTNAAGNAYLWGDTRSRSTRAPGWWAGRQDWPVRGTVTAPFRCHVVFRRVTPLPASTPILDSPVFDDLTLLYRLPSGCRLGSWEAG